MHREKVVLFLAPVAQLLKLDLFKYGIDVGEKLCQCCGFEALCICPGIPVNDLPRCLANGL